MRETPLTLKKGMLMLAVWAFLGWVAYSILAPVVADREASCRSRCAETVSGYRYVPPSRHKPGHSCECEKTGTENK